MEVAEMDGESSLGNIRLLDILLLISNHNYTMSHNSKSGIQTNVKSSRRLVNAYGHPSWYCTNQMQNG